MYETAEKLNSLAAQLSVNAEYDDAIACLRKAVAIDANNYLLWYNLGVTYNQKGDFFSARDMFLRAYSLNKGDPDLLESLALACFSTQDFSSAYGFYSEATALNPESESAWNNFGVLFFTMKDYGNASECFERALSLSPNYFDALYNLRDTYEAMDNEDGVQICEKKLKEFKNQGNG